MDILETLPLGQNRSLVMVRVMDSILLLSQTPQTIVLLEKIEGAKAIELISLTKGGTSIVQFKDFFNTFIGKMKK
jgi:flagellar biogenesis protein FliO